ncbi:MAG: DUF167 domain-containing protein [Gemmatimonadota bacterium]
MSGVRIDVRDHAVRFPVRVMPRASRTELAGVHAGALKIRLQAPPVDGAANDALVQFLASVLHVPRRMIRIVTGTSSRSKVVEVEGIDATAVTRLAGED